jgi:hypothetical protein
MSFGGFTVFHDVLCSVKCVVQFILANGYAAYALYISPVVHQTIAIYSYFYVMAHGFTPEFGLHGTY